MPDYSGQLQVSAWIKKDKNNKTFLTVKLGTIANLFKVEPKDKKLEFIQILLYFYSNTVIASLSEYRKIAF